MKKEEAKEKGLELAERSEIAMLGTNADQGYPHIRGMIKMENLYYIENQRRLHHANSVSKYTITFLCGKLFVKEKTRLIEKSEVELLPICEACKSIQTNLNRIREEASRIKDW